MDVPLIRRSIALLVCLACRAPSAPPPAPLVVNRDASRLPSLPSFDLHGGGLTFVWADYNRGHEWLWTASHGEAGAGEPIELSPGAGVYCQPRFVSGGPAGGAAVWTRQREGRFEVVARRLAAGAWLPVEILSAAGVDAMAPAAAASGAALAVAFERHAGQSGIALRTWNGRAWNAPVAISQERVESYRPALAFGPRGEAWAFWDSYLESERAYAVFARRVLPALGPVERLSAVGRNCLKPAAVYAGKSGWTAAWVGSEEVVGGAGVLDHRDSIQAAVRRDGVWSALPSAGGGDAVPLDHGLLSRMAPAFEPVWGYAGRRRHPMLVEDGGALWLLWERRIHSGGQAHEPGRLCGRRLDGAAWSPPVVLHEGLVEYAAPESQRAISGRLAVVGRDTEHRFLSLTLALDAGVPFEFEPWPGWKPVKLPLHAPAPRPSIEIGGRRHFLYWADLHVHTVLTPDAEGEVDELAHFARDKAALDIVVLQENDSNSWSRKAFRDQRLTASEYALSVWLSRRHTVPGRFVALPGFEWSERTADDKPNHRTVMYAGPDAPIVRHTEGFSFDRLCRTVEAAGGSMFTQHENFRLTGCPVDDNIEVAAGWGVYIQNPEEVHRALDARHRLGFVATGDAHRRNPGTGGGITGIWAPELTPAAVLEALRARRVFATNGSRIALDARANGRFMGDDVETDGPVELRLRVDAPRPVARAVLVRDGREIHTVAGGARQVRAAYSDRLEAGFHWYYWRIELAGDAPPQYRGNVKPAEGLYAWSSPHRVTCRAR